MGSQALTMQTVIPTDQQLADIFTKPLPEAVFVKLVNELGMLRRER